jgi:AcrR family transcriptional regulator
MATKEERAHATRTALMSAARELFTDRGYAAVGTEEIVARAKVTRGALYHHFADKRDLFRAVHEEIEGQLVTDIAAQVEGETDPLELLRTGTRAFLDACLDPSLSRIALLEAPSVLGWAEWREIDMRHGMGLVSATLQGGMEAGVLRRQPVLPLAHLLLAAMGEAALMIANSSEPQGTRDEMEVSLLELVDGLRV